MAKCLVCGGDESLSLAQCPNCGALRYPIDNKQSAVNNSRLRKLKLSAAVAAAIVTPGAFVVLAVVGANRLKNKIKKRNYSA